MNILILNLPGPVLKAGSRWYNKDKAKTRKNILRYYPYPWFMGYATALLKKHGFEVTFKDAIALEWNENQARNYINSLKPEYIICEPTWVSLDDDVKFLNSLDLNAVRIAVGNCATNFPYLCIEKGFDYAVVGEYEFSLLEFFKNEGKQLPVNFVSRQKKQYAYYPLVENLDLFPFPERDDTPIEYYNEPSCYGRNVVMVSSRGCRLKCNFCNVECIYGRHIYRTRSPQNVVDEMEYLKENYCFDEIYFDDDNMVSRKEHPIGICKEIVRRNLKIKWLCMGDGLVDDEVLEWLAKAGCVSYKFGLEHLDEDVLRLIPKPLKAEHMKHIIKKTKELGMRAYVNVMIGLPGSTYKKDLEMVKRVLDMEPDVLQFSIATPYPGTQFYKQAKEQGWLVSDVFDATGEAAVSYPNYSREEITEMFNLAWKMWYKHVILKQPKSLFFYFKSELKREGWLSTIVKSIYYFKAALKGIKETSKKC